VWTQQQTAVYRPEREASPETTPIQPDRPGRPVSRTVKKLIPVILNHPSHGILLAFADEDTVQENT
jgi:hypothetical protein